MISESRQASVRPEPPTEDRWNRDGEPAPKFKAVTRTNVSSQPEWELLDPEIREGIEVVDALQEDDRILRAYLR